MGATFSSLAGSFNGAAQLDNSVLFLSPRFCKK